MFQLKHLNIFKASLLISSSAVLYFIPETTLLFAQGYDDAFEIKNKLKIELQYADYGEYEYPEPILFRYGEREYQQNYPFIVNFPEKRGLIKFSHLLGEVTSASVKYQFSNITENTDQHLLEAKLIRSLNENITGLAAFQFINDSRKFNAYQFGTGVLWDPSVITSVQGDIQYYFRGKNSEVVGGKLGMFNLRSKFRQVLTLSTAAQIEYDIYITNGDNLNFTSHMVAVWLSQFLPTETAVHLNLRYYTNTIGINSLSPSIELAQYIDWATVLHIKYRYYKNQSENVSLGEQNIIVPDGLKTHAFSMQIDHEFSTAVLLYSKYRYYNTNMNIQMNTYMLGFVYSF